MQLSIRSAAGIALAFSAFAFAQSANFKSDLWSGMNYRLIGPYRGGRVTAVTGVPSQPFTFYMGSTGGGVWKTTDAGHTWTNVSDGFFSVASMGAIEVVAYRIPTWCTRAPGRRRSAAMFRSGAGCINPPMRARRGRFIGLRDAGQIATIRIDPTNPDMVYVAALGNPFVPNQGARRLSHPPTAARTWKNVLVRFRRRRRGRSGDCSRAIPR